MKRITNTFAIFTAFLVAVSGFSGASAYAASVNQVATGALSACAVTSGTVKCWGDNTYGQLGNRTTTGSATPVDVYADKDAKPKSPSPCGGLWQPSCVAAVPASPIGGKFVEKVSVGLTHACALADAKVYCWGDNSHGQLGDRSNTSSSMPVIVDMQSKDVTPASYKETSGCGGLWQPSCKTITPAMKPKSSLGSKEVVDIAAGEYFTCALASDGTASCWGEGDAGRLGTNNMTDSNYPKAVYSAGALTGKKGIKLAKANGATMCMLTVDTSFSDAATSGTPYCWGYGIDDGVAMPPNGNSTIECNKNSPTAKPTASSVVTDVYISQSPQPVKVDGANLTVIKGYDYLSSLDKSGKAYYWGMYGFKATTSSFTNIKSCTVNTCVSAAGNRIKLTLSGADAKKKAQQNAKNANKPGGDKNKNLNSNNTAMQNAQNAALGGIATSVEAQGNGIGSYGGSFTNASYSIGGSEGIDGGGFTSINSPANSGNFQGIARPTTSAGQGSSVGNNGNSNGCGVQTHYGFTKTSTYERVGKNVATVPPSWPQSQSGITAVSGNVNNGLSCAKMASGTFCDAHGTSINEGQTGSNYTQKCIPATLFTAKKCEAAPTGPQPVQATGWLAGKPVTELETSITGYTCAIANGSLGCWGVNTYGQLGNGSKTNKNVPTAVIGLQ